MKLEFGNMWDVFGETDLFCFTANSIVKRNGRLVMGCGMAKQVADRYPNLSIYFGAQVAGTCGVGGTFGLIIAKLRPRPSVAAFQTKWDWRVKSSLKLIEFSVEQLTSLANRFPNARFDLNTPGIGYGKLSVEDVLPVLKRLPDNVHIWRSRR